MKVAGSRLQRTSFPARVEVKRMLTCVRLNPSLVKAFEEIIVIEPSAAEHEPSFDKIESNLAPVFWLICRCQKIRQFPGVLVFLGDELTPIIDSCIEARVG